MIHLLDPDTGAPCCEPERAPNMTTQDPDLATCTPCLVAWFGIEPDLIEPLPGQQWQAIDDEFGRIEDPRDPRAGEDDQDRHYPGGY
jgi:hypothetical protein